MDKSPLSTNVDASMFDELSQKMTSTKEYIEKCRQAEAMSEIRGIAKLRRTLEAELKFLNELATGKKELKASHLTSSNLPHLNALVDLALSLEGVTHVFHRFRLNSSAAATDAVHRCCHCCLHCTVDLIAGRGRVWFKVIARNANAAHLIWIGDGDRGAKSLAHQARLYLHCAAQYPHQFEVPTVVFHFTQGVTEMVAQELEDMGVVVQGERVAAQLAAAVPSESSSGSESSGESCPSDDDDDDSAHSTWPVSVAKDSVCQSISQRSAGCRDGVNLDVTTMICLVSELTNGGCNWIFEEQVLTEQAEAERREPVLPALKSFLEGRKLFACEAALNDFESIIATMGGPGERQRAAALLSKIERVPDQPSERTVALKLSAQIKPRSKLVFGTGDRLQLVTTSANASFVRAAEGQNVHLTVYLHASRALTESKEKNAKPIPTPQRLADPHRQPPQLE